jgi:hypothetical protein
VSLAAAGDIASSGQVDGQAAEHERSASLAATGNVSVAGGRVVVEFERAVAITAAATVSSTGQSELQRAVTVSAVAAISVTVEAQEWTYGPVLGWSYLGGTAAVYAGGTAFNYGPGAGWTYHGGD